MPTLLRQDGFEVMIYTNDHPPAHGHVFKAEGEVIINLGDEYTPPQVRENIGMSRRDERKALVIVGIHQDDFTQNGDVFMAKVKIGRWELEEEELERQHQEAKRRGEEKVQTEPQAQAVSYDRSTHRLIIELKNGTIFLLPCTLVQGLAEAASEEIAHVRLGPRGASLHWEKLNVDSSLAGLMAGIFGTRAWMAEIGRIGGRATSEAKAVAARTNGKKGGRPPQRMPSAKRISG